MAKTINTAGSQLFQQNLSNYNRERNRDELTQKAEANRLGNQLTALSLDPDINDPSLGQIGMAASVDPGGIIGTIAGAVGKVKQMDAIKIKAEANEGRTQQMADMIKSNFGEMTDADALMYARDPEKMKQMMNLKDYSQGQEDRKTRLKDADYLRKKMYREDERAEALYQEGEDLDEDFEKNKEDFRAQLEEKFIASGMNQEEARTASKVHTMDRSAFENFNQEIYGSLDPIKKAALWRQHGPLLKQHGVNSLEQLVAMSKVPPAVGNAILKSNIAESFRPSYNAMRKNAGEARLAIATNRGAAQQVVLKNMLPDEMVSADYQKQVDEDNEPLPPPLPDQIEAHRMVMFNREIAKKDSQFFAQFNSNIASVMSPYTEELLKHTARMKSLSDRNPSLLDPLVFRDTEFRDDAIQRLPQGEFFQFGGGTRGMVIDTPNGKSFVDETDPRFDHDSYELLNGGGELQDIIAPVVGGSLDGLISPAEAGEFKGGGNQGTKELDESASEIDELTRRYESLLYRVTMEGAKKEGELRANETRGGALRRNLGEVFRTENDEESALRYMGIDPDVLKTGSALGGYGGVNIPTNYNLTPVQENENKVSRLKEQIKLLEKALKPK
jgi:hypothetical protein